MIRRKVEKEGSASPSLSYSSAPGNLHNNNNLTQIFLLSCNIFRSVRMPHATHCIESVLLRSSSDFKQTVKNRSIVMFRNQKMVWQKTQQIIDPCLPPTFIYFILSESDHRWTAINLPILHRTTAWQLRTVRTFLTNIWTLLPPFYTAIFSINIMSTFSWSPPHESRGQQAAGRPQLGHNGDADNGGQGRAERSQIEISTL